MAVLGLVDPKDGDWGRLRGLQYSSLAKVTVARILANAIAAVAILRLCYGSISIWLLLGWLAVLAGTLWYGATLDKSLVGADQRRMSRAGGNK